ncbi:hypothetical protein CH63R_01456 [Colletotrichum higginsianum IMI 349063]|uniref:Uncharacterized protein n=1 Tax=Colletotrichum higginsianum (strain IMI 349063) TaxID=759273 RepID=A0A1B7YW53_COLHI|nr:hypothetical protein CH63R_01456 [Colletotrichum higginsianum IMI 349063]OBR16276.1 hypothetical protein CH63R_01456 [Colletotrichum higginsianum IMI 349063]
MPESYFKKLEGQVSGLQSRRQAQRDNGDSGVCLVWGRRLYDAALAQDETGGQKKRFRKNSAPSISLRDCSNFQERKRPTTTPATAGVWTPRGALRAIHILESTLISRSPRTQSDFRLGLVHFSRSGLR